MYVKNKSKYPILTAATHVQWQLLTSANYHQLWLDDRGFPFPLAGQGIAHGQS